MYRTVWSYTHSAGTMRKGGGIIMPKTIQAVRRLRAQAAKAIAALEKEIVTQEQELAALKQEAARWQRVLGGRVPRTQGAGAPGRARREGRRVNWSTVLAELPQIFTAKEVAAKADKPIQHAYSYLARWVKEQQVKKGKDGYYKILPGH